MPSSVLPLDGITDVIELHPTITSRQSETQEIVVIQLYFAVMSYSFDLIFVGFGSQRLFRTGLYVVATKLGYWTFTMLSGFHVCLKKASVGEYKRMPAK